MGNSDQDPTGTGMREVGYPSNPTRGFTDFLDVNSLERLRVVSVNKET